MNDYIYSNMQRIQWLLCMLLLAGVSKADILCPARPGPWSFYLSTGAGKYSGFRNPKPSELKYPWQAGFGVRYKFPRHPALFTEGSLEMGKYHGISNNQYRELRMKSSVFAATLGLGYKIPLNHKINLTFKTGLGLLKEHTRATAVVDLKDGFVEETLDARHITLPLGIAFEKKFSPYHSWGLYAQSQWVRDLGWAKNPIQQYFSAGIQLRVHILQFGYMNF
jgi:Protein of unknown function (DUF3575)